MVVAIRENPIACDVSSIMNEVELRQHDSGVLNEQGSQVNH